jgi:hypothetical protein
MNSIVHTWFEDPDFVGILVQQFHSSGDEWIPNGDPIFMPRSAGRYLIQANLGKMDQGDSDVRPLFASSKSQSYPWKHRARLLRKALADCKEWEAIMGGFENRVWARAAALLRAIPDPSGNESDIIENGNTPGPWSYDPETGEISSLYGSIATVHGWDNPDDETQPNGDLLASAPHRSQQVRILREVANQIILEEERNPGVIPDDIVKGARAALEATKKEAKPC